MIRVEGPSMGTFAKWYGGEPYSAGKTELAPGNMQRRFPLIKAPEALDDAIHLWAVTPRPSSIQGIGQTAHLELIHANATSTNLNRPIVPAPDWHTPLTRPQFHAEVNKGNGTLVLQEGAAVVKFFPDYTPYPAGKAQIPDLSSAANRERFTPNLQLLTKLP